MPQPADIHDPTFRSALEHAEQLIDDGDYAAAGRACAETYLLLLERHPELLPPEDLPEVQPLHPDGQPRVAEGRAGLARIDAARAARRNWWPGTGAIAIAVGHDRDPRIEMIKERVSLSEAAGYFEFLLQQLADAQHGRRSIDDEGPDAGFKFRGEASEMDGERSYWSRRPISRRIALRTAALTAGGAAALGLSACSSGAKNGGGGAKAPVAPAAALDPTKGNHGGKIVIQQYGDPGGGLELVKIRNFGVHQLAGFTHDGLLEFRNGTPAFPGTDIGVQPSLAQAMPEQPDPQTYVFKIRPAKFQNGRTLVAGDVKYSYDLYAFGADSALKGDWVFLDSVQAPDDQTVVVKTKFPYADALQDMAQRYSGEILCKEWQESPDSQKKLLGSGPFLFVDYQPPVASHYRRNPDYQRQPYPYFDEIEFLENSDVEKKIADFSAKQVHMTYWFDEEATDRVKKARPDAQSWTYPGSMGNVFFRCDKPPFNDKRVRQALSMAIDRKALSQATTEGKGEPDQALSISGVYWGFRKPSDLGAAAKYWNYDPQAAKQLLQAAGVSLPMKFEMPHWNASVIGQKFVDAITLIEAQWRNAGIADVKDTELTFGQAAGTISIGNYDAAQWYPSTVGYVPDIGLTVKNQLWSPPDGIKAPPTLNVTYCNDQQLSALLDKQIGQFNKDERVQTFRQIEDILAEQQYRVGTITITNTWFGDPSVKNMQTARDAYNGAIPYVKYWWFDKV